MTLPYHGFLETLLNKSMKFQKSKFKHKLGVEHHLVNLQKKNWKIPFIPQTNRQCVQNMIPASALCKVERATLNARTKSGVMFTKLDQFANNPAMCRRCGCAVIGHS